MILLEIGELDKRGGPDEFSDVFCDFHFVFLFCFMFDLARHQEHRQMSERSPQCRTRKEKKPSPLTEAGAKKGKCRFSLSTIAALLFVPLKIWQAKR